MAAASVGSKLLSVQFEIYGRVQGVFFRKFTQKTAKKHNLVGWVINTRNNTVSGIIQGREDQIKEMKTWLKKKGSPQSRIDRTVFSNEHVIEKTTFEDFLVKR